MTTIIEIRELPARLDELIKLAAAGGEVILADCDQPRVRLLPVALVDRVAGLHAGALVPSEDFDAPLPDDFWAGQP